MTIRSNVETVTPAIATQILEVSQEIQNRNVSDLHVDWLASQMKAGKWTLNGEGIILDEHGHLLDGQHRMWAVVGSQVAIDTIVTRGVDRKTFATIDTGKARTSGNVLAINGEKYANVLSAAVGWIHRHEHGKMLWKLKSAEFTSAGAIGLIKKYPAIREAVEWAHTTRKNPILRKVSISVIAFLRFMFVSHKPQKAAEFFDLAADVIQDRQGTPTRILRDWIITKRSGRDQADSLEIMAVAVKAWTAFLDGTRIQALRWRRIGEHPESFPLFPGEQESRGKALKIGKRTGT